MQMECWNALGLLVVVYGTHRRFDSLLIDAGDTGGFCSIGGIFENSLRMFWGSGGNFCGKCFGGVVGIFVGFIFPNYHPILNQNLSSKLTKCVFQKSNYYL
jgi:hypothetical protein